MTLYPRLLYSQTSCDDCSGSGCLMSANDTSFSISHCMHAFWPSCTASARSPTATNCPRRVTPCSSMRSFSFHLYIWAQAATYTISTWTPKDFKNFYPVSWRICQRTTVLIRGPRKKVLQQDSFVDWKDVPTETTKLFDPLKLQNSEWADMKQFNQSEAHVCFCYHFYFSQKCQITESFFHPLHRLRQLSHAKPLWSTCFQVFLEDVGESKIDSHQNLVKLTQIESIKLDRRC